MADADRAQRRYSKARAAMHMLTSAGEEFSAAPASLEPKVTIGGPCVLAQVSQTALVTVTYLGDGAVTGSQVAESPQNLRALWKLPGSSWLLRTTVSG